MACGTQVFGLNQGEIVELRHAYSIVRSHAKDTGLDKTTESSWPGEVGWWGSGVVVRAGLVVVEFGAWLQVLAPGRRLEFQSCYHWTDDIEIFMTSTKIWLTGV